MSIEILDAEKREGSVCIYRFEPAKPAAGVAAEAITPGKQPFPLWKSPFPDWKSPLDHKNIALLGKHSRMAGKKWPLAN